MKQLLIVGFLCSIGAATFATGLSADDTKKSNDLELITEISVATEAPAFYSYTLEAPRFVETPETVATSADVCYSVSLGYDFPASEDPDPGVNQLIYKQTLNDLETTSTDIWRRASEDPDPGPSSVSFLGSYWTDPWNVNRLFLE